jgi:hypothetical protein
MSTFFVHLNNWFTCYRLAAFYRLQINLYDFLPIHACMDDIHHICAYKIISYLPERLDKHFELCDNSPD